MNGPRWANTSWLNFRSGENPLGGIQTLLKIIYKLKWKDNKIKNVKKIW